MTAAVFFADAASTGSALTAPTTSSDAIESGAKAAQTLAAPLTESGGNAIEAARNAGQMIVDTAGQTASLPGTLPTEALFSWSGYFQAIGFMAFLVLLLWAGLWAVRRYGKFRFLPLPGALPRDALRMEAQLPLGPKKGLMVVRFLDRRLLLGVTEQQITLLQDMGLNDDRDRKEHPNFERLLRDDETGENATDEKQPAKQTEQHAASPQYRG